jgi:soluble lytic murein transglycosylase-like protein
MPRIPSDYELSGPASLRSGRVISTYDTTDIGRGLQSFANDLGSVAADQQKQNNVVDVSRAEAHWLKQRLDLQNQAENDTDYSTFSKRYDPQVETARTQSANLIRDPRMRENWLANAQKDAIVANDWVRDKSLQKQKSAELGALNDTYQSNFDIAVDPNTAEPVREKARADIQGSIDQAEQHGFITPEQASEARWKFVHGSYDRELILGAEAKKYSLPDADALTNAMISVESQGNPDAVSNKGAIGLMQVTPDTAAGIAKEIGDTNFPSDPEKQKEYLKGRDVSLIYGKRYMNDMLQKYNGDEEAALIAYNGGPSRADAWLKAGRDDSAIPQETRDYYKKVLGSVPGNTPQQSFDPAQVTAARTYLQSHTNKDASHIDGLQDGFAVKVSNMLQAAPPEIRDKLGVFSGFRSTERQAELYAEAVKKYGPAEARKWVAPPGHSEHNKGDAADLSYDGKSLKDAPPEVVKWVHDNAPQYGLKFPLANENWHIEDSSTRSGKMVKAYPPAWDKASPEARMQVQKIIEQQQKEKSVEDRSIVETASSNAPDAFQNTGQYTGQTPTQEQFVNAYGPLDGPQKQQEYQAAVDTSKQVYDMRSMSGADIQKLVEDSKPVSTGDTAGLDTKRYEVLAKAAATTIAAREADPVTYVRNSFPNVNQAWDDATKTGNYQTAITATMAAQQQLGIRNPSVLPKDVAGIAATRSSRTPTISESDRISAVTGLVFATKDPAQRNAIFNQLVDAGLPDATQGAVEAFARGDDGAGRRLFQAAIIDPTQASRCQTQRRCRDRCGSAVEAHGQGSDRQRLLWPVRWNRRQFRAGAA